MSEKDATEERSENSDPRNVNRRSISFTRPYVTQVVFLMLARSLVRSCLTVP
jgi:hypothetical protein